MMRIIKLLFLFWAYQLSFYSLSTFVYMIVENGSIQMSLLNECSANVTVIMVSQVLSTLAIGIHTLAGKYVRVADLKLASDNRFKILLASVMLIVGMGMWTNYLNEMACLPDTMKEVFAIMMANPLGIISIVILAPIVEELLFRGAIQGYLMRRYHKPYIGIIVSALIFGLIHANPSQIPIAFVIGMALGWMYYITGSILPGIVMHFVNNASAVLIEYLCVFPDSSMVSCLGSKGAAFTALAGMAISVLAVMLIRKKLITKPAYGSSTYDE